MIRVFIGLLFFLTLPALAQTPIENVVLVTVDGLRWQEVFAGADSTLLFDPVYTADTARARKRFWAATPTERRQRLLPFFWNTVVPQGQAYGNRMVGSRMNVSNPHWFSYPGYNEMLSGYADERIKSNDKIDNPNVTVLEFLNQQPGLRGKVAVFSSWDVIEAVVNEKRSGIPANSAYEPMTPATSVDSVLSHMTTLYPHELPGDTRTDFLTYFAARQYVRQKQPRVLFLSFDESDAMAHAGRYADYLGTAQAIDRYVADLWQLLQQMPQYAGKTALLITTDHGRGHTPKPRWKDHGNRSADSFQTWLVATGPGIAATGQQKDGPVLFQSQVAATLANLLGFTFTSDHPVAPPIEGVVGTLRK